MYLNEEELQALNSINEGISTIKSDTLIKLKKKGLITGLTDVSSLAGEAYIIGLDTELTSLGKEAIR